MTNSPQTTSYQSDGISERRPCLRVPRCYAHRWHFLCEQGIGQQGHRPKINRIGRASYVQWPHYSTAAASPHRDEPVLLQRSPHTPPSHEPGQDLQGGMVSISTEECLRLQFALGVAHQHPPHHDRLVSRFVPQTTIRIDLHFPRTAAIPSLHYQRHPHGLGVVQPLLWAGEACAFHTWSPRCPWGRSGADSHSSASRRERVIRLTLGV